MKRLKIGIDPPIPPELKHYPVAFVGNEISISAGQVVIVSATNRNALGTAVSVKSKQKVMRFESDPWRILFGDWKLVTDEQSVIVPPFFTALFGFSDLVLLRRPDSGC